MSVSASNLRSGRFVETPVAGEIVCAYVPPSLPTIALLPLLRRIRLAERALGRIDGITMLPRQELFLFYMYARKEAVLSSQVEGTQSNLSDLIRFETEAQTGHPIDEIREISNYVDEMVYGLERLKDLPLALRLIREMQERLLHALRNGRISRLLVTSYLCVNGLLRKRLLYLSLYLKTHRASYYRLLQEMREHGAWEAWFDFLLTRVADTANKAFEASTRIVDQFKEDRERITIESDRAGSALRVHDLFQQNPLLTANQLVQKSGSSAPTVNAVLTDQERFNIVGEITGSKRERVFSYRRHLAILSEGADPLPTTA